jgi:hypothetical protein
MLAMAVSEEPSNRRLVLCLVAGAIAFVALFVAIEPLGRALGLQGQHTALLMLVPIGATVLFFRFDRRIELARGTASTHLALFQARYVWCIAAHAALLAVANLAASLHWTSGMPLAALSALPAAPLLGMIYVFGLNLVEEADEYQRLQKVEASLWATGVLLAAATVWGVLEQQGLVRHVPANAAFYIWFIGMGIAKASLKFRG